MAEVKDRRTALVQLGVVGAFVLMCATVFGYLWVNSGGKLPLLSQAGYRIAVEIPRVGNLVYFSDVAVNGVLVGKVQELTPEGDHARVVMELNKYSPIHEGAKVRVRAKTLVEESFLEIEDGTGAPLASGTTLPKDAGTGPTQLNDVLLALDPKTRGALASASRSLGAATAGTRQSWSDAMAGLGAVGRGGHDALDALAAQSEDLRELSGNTATLLTALNTQRGQIAQLVVDANRLTTATSEGKDDLAQFMRELPPTLKSVEAASDDIDRIGTALHPVADNLDEAAPDLSAALDDLPDVSERLHDLLPELEEVLDSAPDTLSKVDDLAKDMKDFTPRGKDILTELNPMLGYIKGYKREVASVLPNFAQTLAKGDSAGRMYHALLLFNETTVKASPISTQVGPLDKFNPYPLEGQGYNPSGVGRKFERIAPEPPR